MRTPWFALTFSLLAFSPSARAAPPDYCEYFKGKGLEAYDQCWSAVGSALQAYTPIKAAPAAPSWSQRLAALGQALRDQPSAGAVAGPEPVAPVTALSGRMCMFKRDVVSGFNRICAYDCLGSAYTTNASVGELCPLTVQP